MLDQLRPTSTGLDCLPAWFLKLGAPVFSKPIASLFNLSISENFVPQQWKTAWISPIPKVPAPQYRTDYRPISVYYLNTQPHHGTFGCSSVLISGISSQL